MNNLVAGDIMMARIKELEAELAELKASIPQGLAIIGHIHDEIIDSCESAEECRQEIINYSVTIRAFTQAKEQSE